MSADWWVLRRAVTAAAARKAPPAGEPRALVLARESDATAHLPDSYGPDPVVFGAVPRVRGIR